MKGSWVRRRGAGGDGGDVGGSRITDGADADGGVPRRRFKAPAERVDRRCDEGGDFEIGRLRELDFEENSVGVAGVVGPGEMEAADGNRHGSGVEVSGCASRRLLGGSGRGDRFGLAPTVIFSGLGAGGVFLIRERFGEGDFDRGGGGAVVGADAIVEAGVRDEVGMFECGLIGREEGESDEVVGGAVGVFDDVAGYVGVGVFPLELDVDGVNERGGDVDGCVGRGG